MISDLQESAAWRGSALGTAVDCNVNVVTAALVYLFAGYQDAAG